MTITQLREELQWLKDKKAREPSFLARVALYKRIAAVETKISMLDTDRRSTK